MAPCKTGSGACRHGEKPPPVRVPESLRILLHVDCHALLPLQWVIGVRPRAASTLPRYSRSYTVGPHPFCENVCDFPEAESPRAALRWHLNYLRAPLPEPVRKQLVITPEHVTLDALTDVEIFRHGAKRVLEAPDDPEAAEVLALYRGELCTGLTLSASAVYDTWLYVEQEFLTARVSPDDRGQRSPQGLLTAILLPVIEPLAKLVSVDPYFEEGHSLLVEACEVPRASRSCRGSLSALPAHPAPGVADRAASVIDSPLRSRCPTGRIPPRDRLIALQRADTAYRRLAWRRASILAIHGSTMSAYTFTALAERLSPDIRFVAMDLRGHGFSDKPPTGYSVDQHVEDLRESTAVLGLHRPILLGFSIGGAIAAFLAARGDCSGLVLLEGVVGDRAFTENAAAHVIKPLSAPMKGGPTVPDGRSDC